MASHEKPFFAKGFSTSHKTYQKNIDTEQKIWYTWWAWQWKPRKPKGVSPSGKAQDFDSSTRWFESSYPCQQKTHFCLPTKVRFLNDVCLRQIMLATPMMTASPNDAWLRHILWQTSHHCDQREQHHFERSEKHHIAAGDASFDRQEILWYNKINSPINKNLARC